MSYQIRIPSTNSDKVGNAGAIEFGTPDSIITFPNETGEVATTSDLPTPVPPTIYKRDPSYIAHVRTTTTPTALDNTLVTGLESNYMYKITFMGEAYSAYDGFNFKFQLTTQNGNQPGLGGPGTDMLFTSNMGGLTAYSGIGGGGTSLYTFYPAYYQMINDGWAQAIVSNAAYGSVCFSMYFTTGTTADSRSIVVKYAKGSNSGGWETEDSSVLYGAVVIVEPIKSIL